MVGRYQVMNWKVSDIKKIISEKTAADVKKFSLLLTRVLQESTTKREKKKALRASHVFVKQRT